MAISMTKVKNLLKREFPDYIIPHLKNDRVNGELLGCWGFLENTETGKLAYIHVGCMVYNPEGYVGFFRESASLTDYTGGRNRYAKDLHGLVTGAVELTR